MDSYIVLTMFCFICLVQHSNIHPKQNKILPHKTGEKNVSSDLAISAQKYPKNCHTRRKEINQSTTLFNPLKQTM